MRECSTDRYMDKKKPQRGIAKVHRGIEFVEFPGQQEGADGHGGGFCDERTQQGADRQNRKPPCSRGGSAKVGQLFQGSLGKLEDRV